MAKNTKFGKTFLKEQEEEKYYSGSQAKNREKNIANLYFLKNKT